MNVSTDALECDVQAAPPRRSGSARPIRPGFRWADLWEAPLHDFPVRDELLCQFLPLSSTMNVLEIGPGTGYTAYWLSRKVARITLLDASANSLNEVRRALGSRSNLNFLEWNLDRPGLSGGLKTKFDAAFGLDVFEYVSDPAAAFRNLFEVMRAGADLLLTFPNSPPPGGDAVTYFRSPAEVKALVTAAGFSSCEVFTVNLGSWAYTWHGALHDAPLSFYRRVRKGNSAGLPRVYEQTWAFRHRNGFNKFRLPIHAYWSLLGPLIRAGGEVFQKERPGEAILGRRLVIRARK